MNTPKPFAGSRLAKFLDRRITELAPRKTQAQIAREAGFVSANMITQLKNGSTKLAFARIKSMAKALECDGAHIFALTLEQRFGDTTAKAILAWAGVPITQNEQELLETYREASDYSDPPFTSRMLTLIRKFFGK